MINTNSTPPSDSSITARFRALETFITRFKKKFTKNYTILIYKTHLCPICVCPFTSCAVMKASFSITWFWKVTTFNVRYSLFSTIIVLADALALLAYFTVATSDRASTYTNSSPSKNICFLSPSLPNPKTLKSFSTKWILKTPCYLIKQSKLQSRVCIFGFAEVQSSLRTLLPVIAFIQTRICICFPRNSTV